MFLLLLLIIFIPIPVHITMKYEDSKAVVYLYKFKVFPSKIAKKNEEKVQDITFYSKTFFIKLMRRVYERSKTILLKSTLYLDINLDYGFEDAYITGILYGILQSSFKIIHNLLSLIFKIKKFNIHCNPIFNKSILKITIKSIIFISLAKIIYIALLAFIYFRREFKEYLKLKEAN